MIKSNHIDRRATPSAPRKQELSCLSRQAVRAAIRLTDAVTRSGGAVAVRQSAVVVEVLEGRDLLSAAKPVGRLDAHRPRLPASHLGPLALRPAQVAWLAHGHRAAHAPVHIGAGSHRSGHTLHPAAQKAWVIRQKTQNDIDGKGNMTVVGLEITDPNTTKIPLLSGFSYTPPGHDPDSGLPYRSRAVLSTGSTGGPGYIVVTLPVGARAAGTVITLTLTDESGRYTDTQSYTMKP